MQVQTLVITTAICESKCDIFYFYLLAYNSTNN